MANLTITVDEDVLRRARVRALHRRESVNSYLAGALERYADSDEAVRALDEIGELADRWRAGADGDGRAWRREELHRG